MTGIAQILKGVAAFFWPVFAIVVFWYFRKQLLHLLSALVKQISSGARIKYGDLEFCGVNVFERTAEELRGNKVEKYPATKEQFDDRDGIYNRNHNLFLIHKIRNSAERGTRNAQGKRFDIELSLHSHKGFGDFGSVEYVEYYFGRYFGEPPYGSCYRVGDRSGGYAVVTSAYGEFLCRARVRFRDGTDALLDRYVDFGMSPVLPPASDDTVLGRSK